MKIMSLYHDLTPVQKVPYPKRVLYDVHYIMDEMENDAFALVSDPLVAGRLSIRDYKCPIL